MQRSIRTSPRQPAGFPSAPPLLWLGGSVVAAMMLIGTGLSLLGPLPAEVTDDGGSALRQAAASARAAPSDEVIQVAATTPR